MKKTLISATVAVVLSVGAFAAPAHASDSTFNGSLRGVIVGTNTHDGVTPQSVAYGSTHTPMTGSLRGIITGSENNGMANEMSSSNPVGRTHSRITGSLRGQFDGGMN